MSRKLSIAVIWERTSAAFTAWNASLWRTLAAPITPAGRTQDAFVPVRAVSKVNHARLQAKAGWYRDL
jgi:hypothetical protein